MLSNKENIKLISLSKAAVLLGYKTTGAVTKLIKSNKLRVHLLPNSSRNWIDQDELESLIKPYTPTDG